jgi:hypothetical protein
MLFYINIDLGVRAARAFFYKQYLLKAFVADGASDSEHEPFPALMLSPRACVARAASTNEQSDIYNP